MTIAQRVRAIADETVPMNWRLRDESFRPWGFQRRGNRDEACRDRTATEGGLNGRAPLPARRPRFSKTRNPAFRMGWSPLSCPSLSMRSWSGRTVKRVKGAWLGNTVAMLHYRRIVDAGGIQKWHGHYRDDHPHSTLPIWRGNDSVTIPLAPNLIPMSPVKNAQELLARQLQDA